tara:strand:+ start:738 stop:878 length:141 start_codon:yes stop_codon:yes gene_type:complete
MRSKIEQQMRIWLKVSGNTENMKSIMIAHIAAREWFGFDIEAITSK